MPPTSASHKASSSDRPVPQKGHIATPYVLPPPATHPSLGVHPPPYPSFRPVYSPRTGLFMPVSNQILVGKSVFPVFSETKLQNFQIWLGKRTFFQNYGANFKGGKRLFRPGAPRGWVVFRVPWPYLAVFPGRPAKTDGPARSGSLRAKTGEDWPGLRSGPGDFQPGGAFSDFALYGLIFGPVGLLYVRRAIVAIWAVSGPPAGLWRACPGWL